MNCISRHIVLADLVPIAWIRPDCISTALVVVICFDRVGCMTKVMWRLVINFLDWFIWSIFAIIGILVAVALDGLTIILGCFGMSQRRAQICAITTGCFLVFVAVYLGRHTHVSAAIAAVPSLLEVNMFSLHVDVKFEFFSLVVGICRIVAALIGHIFLLFLWIGFFLCNPKIACTLIILLFLYSCQN